jgi:hypothetical protein
VQPFFAGLKFYFNFYIYFICIFRVLQVSPKGEALNSSPSTAKKPKTKQIAGVSSNPSFLLSSLLLS